MKEIWIGFMRDDFRALLDLLTKLEAMDLPEDIKSIVAEIKKKLF